LLVLGAIDASKADTLSFPVVQDLYGVTAFEGNPSSPEHIPFETPGWRFENKFAGGVDPAAQSR